MQWRRLLPGELDHELLWLLVSCGAAVLAVFWLQSGIPTPRCVWHDLTGIPCVGCGSTRCVRHALHGDWGAAFAMNPLAFVTLAGIVLFDLYAAAVLILRLPRLRFTPWPNWAGWTVRGIVLALILLNWAWLIASGV